MKAINQTLIFNPPISLSFKLSFVLRLFWVFSIISFISLILAFVFQINDYTRAKYLISDYQKKIKNVSKENKVLEVELLRANSLGNINNFLAGFEKTEKTEYLQILGGTAIEINR